MAKFFFVRVALVCAACLVMVHGLTQRTTASISVSMSDDPQQFVSAAEQNGEPMTQQADSMAQASFGYGQNQNNQNNQNIQQQQQQQQQGNGYASGNNYNQNNNQGNYNQNNNQMMPNNVFNGQTPQQALNQAAGLNNNNNNNNNNNQNNNGYNNQNSNNQNNGYNNQNNNNQNNGYNNQNNNNQNNNGYSSQNNNNNAQNSGGFNKPSSSVGGGQFNKTMNVSRNSNYTIQTVSGGTLDAMWGQRKGVRVEDLDPESPCLTANGGCHEHARCTNVPPKHPGERWLPHCVCETGFEGNGYQCQEKFLYACQKNNGGCDVNALCQRSPSGVTCSCNKGYKGDGTTCTDVDECLVDNGGCSKHAICTNTNGSFYCTCKNGFAGDGYACVARDLCGNKWLTGCDNRANCSIDLSTDEGYRCKCDNGKSYIESRRGKSCGDKDECESNGGLGDCHLLAICTNTPAGHQCTCKKGYAGNGVTRCDAVNPCLTNNGGCHKFATCFNVEQTGDMYCKCNPGYAGDPYKNCVVADKEYYTSGSFDAAMDPGPRFKQNLASRIKRN